MFGLFTIEAGSEPVAFCDYDGKPAVFETGAEAAYVATLLAQGRSHYNRYSDPIKVQPRRLSSDAWKAREAGRFADGTYIALPWADLPLLSITADHFAHISTEDGAKVAYTQDAAKGAGDIQTRVRPGKYLTQFYGDALDAPTISRMATEFSSQYGESLVLQFADTKEEIERVYVSGPSSCMSHATSSYASKVHPCTIYAAGDLAVAYMVRNDEITARALCWPAKKLYGRIYGDETRLTDLLESACYSAGSLDGAKMLRIEQGNGFVCPYIDGNQSARDDGEFLIIGRGDINAGNQNGLSAPELCCEECGDVVDETYCQTDDDGNSYCDACYSDRFGYCARDEETCYRDTMEQVITTSSRGRYTEQSWGARAVEAHSFVCEGNGDRYDDDLCVTLADGTTWSDAYFEDHGFVCEGNGDNYSCDDCVTLEDGTLWSQDYFDDHGIEVDGENYAKGSEPQADEEEAEDAPETAVASKPFRGSPTVHCDAQLELALPIPGAIKVGDWVECLGHIKGEFTIGKLYLVTSIYEAGKRISVKEDDSGSDNGWSISEFKLPMPWRVAGPDSDGDYRIMRGPGDWSASPDNHYGFYSTLEAACEALQAKQALDACVSSELEAA